MAPKPNIFPNSKLQQKNHMLGLKAGEGKVIGVDGAECTDSWFMNHLLLSNEPKRNLSDRPSLDLAMLPLSSLGQNFTFSLLSFLNINQITSHQLCNPGQRSEIGPLCQKLPHTECFAQGNLVWELRFCGFFSKIQKCFYINFNSIKAVFCHLSNSYKDFKTTVCVYTPSHGIGHRPISQPRGRRHQKHKHQLQSPQTSSAQRTDFIPHQ